MLELVNESIHLTPVAPTELSLKVSSCKAPGSTRMSEL